MKKKIAAKKHKVSKSKGFSLKTTLALIIIVLLIGIGTTMMYYSFYNVVYVETFDIHIETGEYKHIGINADSTLNFGKIPSTGGIAKKEFNLDNNMNFPVTVSILLRGDAAGFIRIDENDFILQPGENRKLPIYAVVPTGFGIQGNFTGKATVKLLRI
ncbi:MAG: hypothetical protein ABIA62_04095 [Candidatus Woesearchaeota archaeon]